MAACVGMITIGQSPRDDVVPEIKSLLGPRTDIVERGALDGLSIEEVKSLSPSGSDQILVTRMRGGQEVTVAESKVVVRIQHCIDDLAKQCDLLAVLCTGRFPELSSTKIILMPDALLDGVVNATLGVRTLGVLIPSAEQKRQVFERWKRPGRNMIVENASPYSAKDEVTPSAQRLAVSSPDLVVLDCMGYTFKARDAVKRVTGKPVILPRSILARSIMELVG